MCSTTHNGKTINQATTISPSIAAKGPYSPCINNAENTNRTTAAGTEVRIAISVPRSCCLVLIRKSSSIFGWRCLRGLPVNPVQLPMVLLVRGSRSQITPLYIASEIRRRLHQGRVLRSPAIGSHCLDQNLPLGHSHFLGVKVWYAPRILSIFSCSRAGVIGPSFLRWTMRLHVSRS